MILLSDNAMRGMPLEPTTVASVDNYMLAAVLILFIVLGFNARHIARLFQGFANDMWSVRQRNNIFDEHVAGESQTLLLLLLQTSVLEGALLWSFFGNASDLPAAQTFGLYTLLAIAFNVFSVAACSVVGYTFTSHAMAVQWRRGLYSSQAMLGILLLVPAVIVIVRPNASTVCVGIGVTLYILARLLYIFKGIRIFYTHFYSWVFFILYLCTLEIIPILAVVKIIPWIG